MTRAAKSVYYFGFYLYLTGLTLIFIPGMFLASLGLPATNEVWIRVVGILALAIGYYYHQTALQNNTAFFRLTVFVRTYVLLAFILLVLFKLVQPVLILIGLVDFVGAMWTRDALKKSNLPI